MIATIATLAERLRIAASRARRVEPPPQGLAGIRQHEEIRGQLHLSWVLDTRCNHACSYCPPELHTPAPDPVSLDAARRFVERLLDRRAPESLHVSFAGGEPTLWSGFAELVAFLAERGCAAGVTTNASRPARWWEGVAPGLDWVSASYHPEFARDEAMLESLAVIGAATHLHVRVLMHEGHWDRCLRFAERVGDAVPNHVLELVQVQDGFGGEQADPWSRYDEAQRRFFREEPAWRERRRAPVARPVAKGLMAQWVTAEGALAPLDPSEVIASGRARFEGWRCHAGLEQLFVDARGSVYRASCGAGGALGRIGDAALRLPTEPVRCPLTWCGCGTDISVTKYPPRERERVLSAGAPGTPPTDGSPGR